jgi:PmbA protein
MTDHLALADRLLDAARKAGADEADVLVAEESGVSIGIAEGALEEAERSETLEIGLRVLIGRRQATVAASDARDETLAALAERAVAIAREAPEDPWCGLADPSELTAPADIAALDLVDPTPAPSPEALEETARAAEAAALAVEGVAQVEQASASWGGETIALAATNGFSVRYARSSGGTAVSAIAGEGLGRERDFAAEFRRHRADIPAPEEVGRRAGERAVAALNPKRPPGGRFPVVYDERVAGSLVGHVLAAVNGSAVARGASWLSEAMDGAILPGGIDLWEDPLIPRGRASRPVDAEGIGARRLDIVSDGVLRSWVLDLATARQLGLATTGNARRGPGGPPRPGTGNVRITQGPRSRADLLAEMGTGLLVTSMIGASINPNTGAYSRGASGFWVEGGEIVHPVNEITIAGSLPAMIRSIRPADDADPHRAVSAPSLLVEGLTVGA